MDRGNLFEGFSGALLGAWLDAEVDMAADDDDNNNNTPKKTEFRRTTITPDMFVERVDDAKVAKALTFLKVERAKAGKSKLDEAFAIGDYLYSEFFGRNPVAYTYKGRNSPSLRALMEHPEFADLGLSRSTVANYITVVIQRDRFEAYIAKERLTPQVRDLGFTQRVRLAPCRKPIDEIRIATLAAEMNLSPGEVKMLVREANATKVGKGREPEAEAVVSARRLYQGTVELAGMDRAALAPDDLRSLETLSRAVTRLLDQVADLSESDLASRPGAAPAPSITSTMAPSTTTGLDGLLEELVGDGLGLGEALRKDAAKLVRHHGGKMLENLEHADPAEVEGWFIDFAATVAAKLNVTERLAAKLGVTTVRETPPASGGGRRTWYVIKAHDAIPDVPFNDETFFSGIFNPAVTPKCIVHAADPEDAVRVFRERAVGLDADVENSEREFEAEPLAGSLGKRETIRAYLARPRQQRRPTLDEFIDELRRAGTGA